MTFFINCFITLSNFYSYCLFYYQIQDQRVGKTLFCQLDFRHRKSTVSGTFQHQSTFWSFYYFLRSASSVPNHQAVYSHFPREAQCLNWLIYTITLAYIITINLTWVNKYDHFYSQLQELSEIQPRDMNNPIGTCPPSPRSGGEEITNIIVQSPMRFWSPAAAVPDANVRLLRDTR